MTAVALALLMSLAGPAGATPERTPRVERARRVMLAVGGVLVATGALSLAVAAPAAAIAAGGLGAGAYYQGRTLERPIDTYQLQAAQQRSRVAYLVGYTGVAVGAVSGLAAVTALGVGGALLVGGWLGL
ncbi:MAG: hypothetical protein HY904_00155 [Deltaproteobacteria bacterium]|nr:hypothetical protein [Deltaproteobacteria bacterium]